MHISAAPHAFARPGVAEPEVRIVFEQNLRHLYWACLPQTEPMVGGLLVQGLAQAGPGCADALEVVRVANLPQGF